MPYQYEPDLATRDSSLNCFTKSVTSGLRSSNQIIVATKANKISEEAMMGIDNKEMLQEHSVNQVEAEFGANCERHTSKTEMILLIMTTDNVIRDQERHILWGLRISLRIAHNSVYPAE
jgi:uncharacterized 2Fe-2S/4Fe-4S cluster protein (DUF4445 family)